METHFRGPIGEYRCVCRNATVSKGWSVERIMEDGKIHLVSMHMTRENAFMHARGMSGLHDPPDVSVIEPEEPLPDRRGLVAHTRALA